MDPPFEFPFEVYYPFGGPHLIAQWWTYHEQHHLLVARRPAQIEALLARVLREDADAQVKLYAAVEIVGPPPALRAQHAAEAWAAELESFGWTVADLLRDYTAAHGTADVPGLVRCADYVAKDPDPPDAELSAEGRAYRAERRRDHADCARCLGGYVPAGRTWAEVYRARRAEVLAAAPRYGSRRTRRVPSQAPPAADDTPLWAALASPGHHQPGTEVRELPLRDADGAPVPPAVRFRRLGTDTLFLCTGLRHLDATHLHRMTAAARQAWRDRQAASARADKAERQAERRARAGRLLDWLRPLP